MGSNWGRVFSQVFPAVVAHWGHLVRFRILSFPSHLHPSWVLILNSTPDPGSTWAKHFALWASQVAQ